MWNKSMLAAFLRHTRELLEASVDVSRELSDLFSGESQATFEEAMRVAEAALERFREAERAETALMEREREKAFEDWNRDSAGDNDGDAGVWYCLSVQNFRRGELLEERLYEVVVFSGPLYKVHCNNREAAFVVREIVHPDLSPEGITAGWTNLEMLDDAPARWEYRGDDFMLAEARAVSGNSFYHRHLWRIRDETQRWEAQWEARLPWVRLGFYVFFKGAHPELQKLALAHARELWLAEAH